MMLVCSNRCGGRLFPALFAEVEGDAAGEFPDYRVAPHYRGPQRPHRAWCVEVIGERGVELGHKLATRPRLRPFVREPRIVGQELAHPLDEPRRPRESLPFVSPVAAIAM